MTKVKVGIIGVGMVGTPLARWFEERLGYRRGRELFLFDTNPEKSMQDDVSRADVIFISVPTPRGKDGVCNLSAVNSAVKRIKGSRIIVIKSTVPPGTTESFQRKYPRHKFLFNPENLTERMAWEDFVRPDAQIVGFTEKSKNAAAVVLSLLPKAPFMSPWGIGTYRRIQITATEAEIIKYARNVHFARKVVFANALAMLSETMGVDYENVRVGMSADFRVGDSHLDVLHGGYRGYGGYCFPKDVQAFMMHLDAMGLSDAAKLIKGDHEFNRKLLASQGLTYDDVSVHDAEWVRARVSGSHGSFRQARSSTGVNRVKIPRRAPRRRSGGKPGIQRANGGKEKKARR